jgi:PLD-like domain
MQHAIFKDFPKTICHHLSLSEKSIDIAVCWFTNEEIFEILKEKLAKGIKIRLQCEYDNQNFKPEGIDFQTFIQNGAQLFVNKSANLMHHKFAIIDSKILLTGSYNWTYNSNAENLLISDDLALIESYSQEFESLMLVNYRLYSVKYDDLKIFLNFPLFLNTQFSHNYLRKKVSLGTKTWYIKSSKKAADLASDFQSSTYQIDHKQQLKPFWKFYQTWNEAYFREDLEKMELNWKPKVRRAFNLFLLKMQIGEYLLSFDAEGKLMGFGVIQSEPMMTNNENYSTYRNVQWLKIFTENAFTGEICAPKGDIGTYKGSMMQLLQFIFAEKATIPVPCPIEPL